jgi:zinc transport system substrate-binding protein
LSLSARNLQVLAEQIRDELITLAPAQAEHFEQNFQLLSTQLQELDTDILTLLAQRRSDYFFVSHAAFGHFARDYGLKQVALENEGRQLGPRSLAQIIRKAENEKVSTLFVQKQHPSASAKVFAQAIDARIVEVDPLTEDTVRNLRHFATQISQALR